MKLKFVLPLAGLLLAGCATRTHTVSSPPPGPTLAEVQSMVQAHVSDAVIVNQIQSSSTRYALTSSQIITLKEAGASDAVLNALISSVNKPATQTTTVIESGPYVQPYVYVNPWPWWGWWGYGPHYGGYYYHGYYHGGGYYHHGGGPHH